MNEQQQNLRDAAGQRNEAPRLSEPPTQVLPARRAGVPTAILRQRQRPSFAWLLPLAALIFAAWLGYRAWQERGLLITIQLQEGHGLKSGDDVRYRGIAVGRVEEVTLAPDMQGIAAHVRLNSQADKLARPGTRFWVVRPQVRLTRVEGLETLIGPRYLAVMPATEHVDQTNDEVQRRFVALNEPPLVERIDPGDLEIILQSSQRGSLHPGAPVMYRQTRVGTILSVGLASDAGSVEARVHIQKAYLPLIRTQTVFWDVGGVQAKLGFTGLTVDIQSAEALLSGGVALATPPIDDSSEIVRTGHRFTLAAKVDEDWLSWQPMVAIGNSLLPAGAPQPSPLRAALAWKQGRMFTRERSRHGWVLQTDEGLLGPADLLKPAPAADPGSAVLEVAGVVLGLDEGLVWEHNGLALMRTSVPDVEPWPQQRQRVPNEPEDCIAIADPAAAPLPLAASRMKSRSPTWLIDPAISIDENWHGACVVSRQDGRLIGMLLVEKGRGRVALLDAANIAR